MTEPKPISILFFGKINFQKIRDDKGCKVSTFEIHRSGKQEI
jgi:hypothetical protein